MDAALRDLGRRRAAGACEYYHLPEAVSNLPFEIDHVIELKHGGPTRAGNLALFCFHCNSHKGTDLTAFDPRTRRLVRLFNPAPPPLDPAFPLGRSAAGGANAGRPGDGQLAPGECRGHGIAPRAAHRGGCLSRPVTPGPERPAARRKPLERRARRVTMRGGDRPSQLRRCPAPSRPSPPCTR